MNQLKCQQQITLANCPIHVNCPLKRLQTKKTGRVFFSCSEKSCPIFCFEDKAGDYLNALNTKLLPIYRIYTPLCQCQKSTLVKMVPGSWRDLGKILARFPPGSRRESCRDSWREAGFPAGILPGFLAGDGIPGGQNLGGILAGILPGFLAGDGIPGGQNLGGNLAGILGGRQDSRRESCQDSWRETGFPAAKISAGFWQESCRDSWWGTGFPAAKISAGILLGFLAGGEIPGGQNLGGIPAGIFPGFLAGDGIPGGQNLGGIQAGILPGFLAAKISAGSRRESCRDSWRVTGYLGGSVAGIRGGKQNPLQSKSC